jgi:uncharacterized membrane protein
MSTTLHLYYRPDALTETPKVRKIEPRDCFAALAEGFDDVQAMPTYPAFLGLFYALAGVALVSLSSFANALHLAFPLAAGFALVGPFVAVGLYEMSRRRELGLNSTGLDAFGALRSPALPSILALGLVLLAIFAAWIEAAHLLYVGLYGPAPPFSAIPFFLDVLTTGRGWMLLVLGGAIGFCFATFALCISVVSFPLMLDRDIGFIPAIAASLRVSRENPVAVALWGFIVAVTLVVGSLPLFIGLAVAMPLLGHSTWRFYRRVIERDLYVERPIAERRSTVNCVERVADLATASPHAARRAPDAI